MSDGDVGNSRDSLDDAPPDSFWEIGMFKRTVKRIEDGDRICDQMIKVQFFLSFSFLFCRKFRISRASSKKFCISTRPKFSREPEFGQILPIFRLKKTEIRPKPCFVHENSNLVRFGPFLVHIYRFTDRRPCIYFDYCSSFTKEQI